MNNRISAKDLDTLEEYTKVWMKHNNPFINYNNNNGEGSSYTTIDTKRNNKNMDITRIEYSSMATIEQLIMAESYMELVTERIKSKGYEVPEELSKTLENCSCDLKYKLKNKHSRQLAELKVKKEQLLSNEEKINKIDEEILKLEKLLS